LPIWTGEKKGHYFFDDEYLLEVHKKKGKTSKIVLTLIVFQLIVNYQLSLRFDLEELIEILTEPNETGEKTVLQEYLDLYTAVFKSHIKVPKKIENEIKELKKVFSYADKKSVKSFEQFEKDISKYLQKSFLLKQQSPNVYEFLFKPLTTETELKRETSVLDDDLLNAILMIEKGNYLQKSKKTPQTNILLSNRDDLLNIIKTIILNISLHDMPPFDKVYMFESTYKSLEKKI